MVLLSTAVISTLHQQTWRINNRTEREEEEAGRERERKKGREEKEAGKKKGKVWEAIKEKVKEKGRGGREDMMLKGSNGRA